MDSGKIKGHLYDIQGYSVHDGPGIRTTVYVKGCPLSCLWCHSPESQRFDDELSYLPIRCVGSEKCGACLSRCPQGALSLAEEEKEILGENMIRRIQVDRGKCTNCLACVKSCPANALMSSGYVKTVDEVLARVLKDRDFYGTDGGLTISGGEPMAQFEFTYALAQKAKEAGISVCLDTTGYAAKEKIEEILPVIDLFLYDLKEMDSQKSKAFAGVNNEQILENARLIAEKGGKLQIRVPVIPKLNADMKNIRETAAFCKELGKAVTCVQVLPYHRMGIPKYERIGWKYKLTQVEQPDDAFMKERLEIFLQEGLPAQLN